MSFQFPTLLLIGLPVLAAVVLIHLLNLRRQRRVEWAAIEYLLESEQRSKNWVNLKQWLLLAARLLAVLLATLMLARPRLDDGLAQWFTGSRVHHLIVLDDSYSMSDRGAGGAVWDQAIAAVERIATAAEKNPANRVSVLLASQSLLADEATPDTATGPAEIAGLLERVRALRTTEMAPPLVRALEAAQRVARDPSNSAPVVAYVLSDFRQRDCEPLERIEEALAGLRESCSAMTLAGCSNPRQENLAISELTLLPGARVAGIELTARVTVQNFGRSPASKVAVRLSRDGQPLPSIEIGDIAARGSAAAKFPVRFDKAGGHTLVAELEADAIEADNRRYFADDLPEQRQVLIVDGSPGEAEGFAYATALRPRDDRGELPTGWQPELIAANELAAGVLNDAAAVLLLDVPRFTPEASAAIVSYAEAGGGVFLEVGPSVDRKNYNRQLLGAAKSPLLPLLLDLPTQAQPPEATAAGDVRVTDHPLFRVFSGDRNSFLNLIRINYYQSLQKQGDEPVPAGVQAIAELHDGSPLVVEATNANRRVLALLTTVSRPRRATEAWSNLGASPVFPVIANELAAYLAAPRLVEPQVVAGRAWASVDWGDSPLATAARFEVPADARGKRPAGDEAFAPTTAGWRNAITSGATRRIAVNVDSQEGDLAALGIDELGEALAGVDASAVAVDDLLRSDVDRSTATIDRSLGAVLLALLLAERLLAVLSSYHQPAEAGAAA